MNVRNPYYGVVAILCLFFLLVFLIGWVNNPWQLVMVLAGESSIGTWMSGVLLIMASTISMIIGMRRGWNPWWYVGPFFILLALDERFMFHERIKAWLIFKYYGSFGISNWLYELPVILGACVGIAVTRILWTNFNRTSRVLLIGAALLGTASVVIDIFAMGVVPEECFKLLAELLIVCALYDVVE